MISLYRPGDSVLHRLPAGAKLLGLMVLAIGISLYPHDPISVAAVLVAVIATYALAGFGPAVIARQLWQTRWIVVLMVVTQLVFLTPEAAVVNTSRVVAIVMLAGLLTLTTRSEHLLDALQSGLRPLARIGVDPARVGLTLSLAISMVPVVAGLAARVREAQRARGVHLGIRAVVPLLVLSLRHADDVGDALAARGVD